MNRTNSIKSNATPYLPCVIEAIGALPKIRPSSNMDDLFNLSCDQLLDSNSFKSLTLDDFMDTFINEILCDEDLPDSPLPSPLPSPLSSDDEKVQVTKCIQTFAIPKNYLILSFKLFSDFVTVQFFNKSISTYGYYLLKIDNGNVTICNLLENLTVTELVNFVSDDWLVVSNYSANIISIYDLKTYKLQLKFQITSILLNKQVPTLIIKNDVMYVIVNAPKVVRIYCLRITGPKSKILPFKCVSKQHVIICEKNLLPYIFLFSIFDKDTICECYKNDKFLWATKLSLFQHIYHGSVFKYNSTNVFITYNLNAHQVIYDIDLTTGNIVNFYQYLSPVSLNMCCKISENVLMSAVIVDNSLYFSKLEFDTFSLFQPILILSDIVNEKILNIYPFNGRFIIITTKNIYKLNISEDNVVIFASKLNTENVIRYNSKYVIMKPKNSNSLSINIFA